jgi:hypothetical protein
MRGFESKAAEVRRAVERLSDAGIVERVRLAPVNNETRPPEGKVVVTVTVLDWDRLREAGEFDPTYLFTCAKRRRDLAQRA